MTSVTNISVGTNKKTAPVNQTKNMFNDLLNKLKTTADKNKRIEILNYIVSEMAFNKNSPSKYLAIKELTLFFHRELNSQKKSRKFNKINYRLVELFFKSFVKSKEEVALLAFAFLNSYVRYSEFLKGEENLIHQSANSLIKNRVGDCDDYALFCYKIFNSFKINNRLILMYWDRSKTFTKQNADVLFAYKINDKWGYFQFEDQVIDFNRYDSYKDTIIPFKDSIINARTVNADKWLYKIKKEVFEEDDFNNDLYIHGNAFKKN